MPDESLPQFGISEFTTNPWSFAEDVKNYAAIGVHTIEICEAKLEEGREEDQLAQALDAGFQISSVQPAVRTLYPSQSMPEPKELGARMTKLRKTISLLSSKTPGVPYVSNTGPPPSGSMQQAIDTSVKEYGELADFAADHGVRVALEPLNATIVNIETAIWTLAQAREIVAAVDRANFGICLDFWNIWQNAGIEQEIRACGDRIFIVQVSDWRTPRSFQDRLIPGQGSIPIPALLRATRESGYQGPYVVEIFSDHVPNSLWSSDLAQVVKDSKEGFQAAWEQSYQ